VPANLVTSVFRAILRIRRIFPFHTDKTTNQASRPWVRSSQGGSMAGTSGTLETIGEALPAIFRPIEDRLRAGDVRLLLAELGLAFPATIDADSDLSAAMESAVQRIRDATPIIAALQDAIQSNNTAQIIA